MVKGNFVNLLIKNGAETSICTVLLIIYNGK